MMRRTRSTRISAPPPGSESRPASRRRESVSGTVSFDRRAMCWISGGDEGVQVDRVARLDRAEQILVPVDVEVGVVAALHQERRAAERQRLLDLLEDHRPRQDVALAAIARAAVEGAEVAVGDADVGVVDVAVDDERDLVRDRRCDRAPRRRRGRPPRGRASAAARRRRRRRAARPRARRRGSRATCGRVRRRLPSSLSVRPRARRSADRGRLQIAAGRARARRSGAGPRARASPKS